MAEVYVVNRTRAKIEIEPLRGFARRLLESTREWRNAELSISFVGDRAIQTLNERWRGKPRPTDVLSFPMEDDPEPGKPLLMGDIVISPRQALLDAAEERTTPEAKFRELILHSVMHLMGFDHETPADTRRMDKQQRLLLAKMEKTK
jgi:probable rRNA maturation factor